MMTSKIIWTTVFLVENLAGDRFEIRLTFCRVCPDAVVTRERDLDATRVRSKQPWVAIYSINISDYVIEYFLYTSQHSSLSPMP